MGAMIAAFVEVRNRRPTHGRFPHLPSDGVGARRFASVGTPQYPFERMDRSDCRHDHALRDPAEIDDGRSSIATRKGLGLAQDGARQDRSQAAHQQRPGALTVLRGEPRGESQQIPNALDRFRIGEVMVRDCGADDVLRRRTSISSGRQPIRVAVCEPVRQSRRPAEVLPDMQQRDVLRVLSVGKCSRDEFGAQIRIVQNQAVPQIGASVFGEIHEFMDRKVFLPVAPLSAGAGLRMNIGLHQAIGFLGK